MPSSGASAVKETDNFEVRKCSNQVRSHVVPDVVKGSDRLTLHLLHRLREEKLKS